MTTQTIWLLNPNDDLAWSGLIGFIFCATLFVYAVHRVVGLDKVAEFKDKGRFQVIATFRSHIVVYAILAALGAILFFSFLKWHIQLAVIIPALLALGYVLPFLTGRRRMRDIHFVKIFMIATVWTLVTVGLPFLNSELPFSSSISCLFVERFLFIFAITIPFDIRDLQVDQHTQVKTIPSSIGIEKSKLIAIIALGLSLLSVWFNTFGGFYDFSVFIRLAFSLFCSGIFIYFSDQMTHDYYFTGLLDGMMILQFLILIV